MPAKGRTPASFRPLQDLATHQHGVASMGQLLDLGYSPDAVLEWGAYGRLQRLHRGVYAVGHRRLTWYSRCWAAVLAAEPDEAAPWRAVASHYSAAYLWGLLRFTPDVMHVTAPTRRRAKRNFRVHFSSILAEEDRAVCQGIPVTAVPRVLLDLAIRARPEQLDGYLERAEDRELLDVRAVEDVLARAGGHRGRGRLAQALAIYRPILRLRTRSSSGAFASRSRLPGFPLPRRTSTSPRSSSMPTGPTCVLRSNSISSRPTAAALPPSATGVARRN